MNKTLKLVAFGLLALIATANMQAMQPAQQPSRWATFKAKVNGFKDSAKAKATSASNTIKHSVGACAGAAWNKIDAWTPNMVKNAAISSKNFLSRPAVYYPLTALVAAGLGYKSYSIYKDEFEFTKKAAAYAAGSALSGVLFLKEPVMQAACGIAFLAGLLKR